MRRVFRQQRNRVAASWYNDIGSEAVLIGGGGCDVKAQNEANWLVL